MLTNGSYATVWDIKPKDNSVDLRITTSRKGKDGEYVTDFNGYIRVINNKAAPDVVERALKLQPKDRIHVLSFGVQNQFNKDKNVTYWNVVMFNFETAEEANANPAGNAGAKADIPAEDLPF